MANAYELQFGVTVAELARTLYQEFGYKGRPYVNTCEDQETGRGRTQFDVTKTRDRGTVLFHITVPEENAWKSTIVTSASVGLVTRKKSPADLETVLEKMIVPAKAIRV